MPMTSTSTYAPGSSTTKVAGGDNGLAAFAAALLAREQDYLRARPAAPPVAAPVPRGMASAPPEVGTSSTAPVVANPRDEQLRRLQQRDAILQMQARQAPPPMRAVTGFNMIGSAGGQDTLDVYGMNAYQRDAYLPAGSNLARGPSAGGDGDAYQALLDRTRPQPGGGSLGTAADLERARMLAALARGR